MAASGYDVVVVGAGPAGATAAIAARQQNPRLRVLLVDRATFPRDKVCGDGLGAGAVGALRRLGLLDLVADAIAPNTVRVSGPDGTEGTATGPLVDGRDLSGFVLPRLTLDARLLSAARGHGVETLEGAAFQGSDLTGTGREIRLKVPSGERLVTARLLVGADGAYSRVRRDLGLARPNPRFVSLAIRCYVTLREPARDGPATPPLRLDFRDVVLPGYGWVFPVAPGRANVGVGLPLDIIRRRSLNPRQLLMRYLDDLSRRGFEVGEPGGIRSHHLPNAGRLAPLVHPRAVLIGDAASMINSLSGEGIGYGLIAGELLGAALARWDGVATAPLMAALQRFERGFRRRLRLHFLSCEMGHRALRSRRWADLVLRAAARDQRVMNDAARMLFDEQRMRPSTGMRIVRYGLRG